MRNLAAFTLGYFALIVTGIAALSALRSVFGPDALLEEGQWRLVGWLAVLGPVLAFAAGVIAGLATGSILQSPRAGLGFAAILLAVSVTASLTEGRRADESPDRQWTPKLTEMVRRVREPRLAMIVGSCTIALGFVVGTTLAMAPRRRRDAASEPWTRQSDQPRLR